MQMTDLDDALARLDGMTADQIKQFIAAAKIKAAEARRAATAKAKKEEARRLILDGRLLGHLEQQGKIDGDMIAQARADYLDNNKDRALFGLPPIAEKAAAKRGRGRPKKAADVIEAVGAVVVDAEPSPEPEPVPVVEPEPEPVPEKKSWWSS